MRMSIKERERDRQTGREEQRDKDRYMENMKIKG